MIEAERQFNEAVAHMDQKRYDLACPLLEQSHALDPSSGTLLNLGDCYEQLGQTGSAYRAFEEARELATSTNKGDRARVAEIRMQRLAKVLRRLTIAPPENGTTELVIRVDDQPLPLTTAPIDFVVDPGPHDVRASAPGFVEHRVSVAAPDPGQTTLVRVPPLTPLSAASAAPSDESVRAQDFSSRQIAALVTGGVGVAGIVVGSVFGLRSQSKHDESDRYCTGDVCGDRRGVELMNQARSAGNASTVSFIVGGVALGTAAALWFVRFPGDGDSGAELGLGPAALHVRGAF